MALQVKRFATKYDDLSLVPEAHMVGKRKQTPASCPQHTHHTLNKQRRLTNIFFYDLKSQKNSVSTNN